MWNPERLNLWLNVKSLKTLTLVECENLKDFNFGWVGKPKRL